MASTTNSTEPNNDDSSSYFQKTVCLYDWWLIKTDKDFKGKQLAIAGLTSRQREAVRPFVSAPIVKRYDTFSLETADGIYIILRGLINKLHSGENGFPPEVFNHFLFGFPRDWECYAVNCFTVELTTGIDSGSTLISRSTEIGPEVFSSVAEESSPALLCSDSEEKTSGNNEKSITEDSRNVSEIGWGSFASSNVSNRFRGGVRNIKICDQKKTTSGGPSRHPDKERNPTSESLENSDREKLNSHRSPIQSREHIDESSEETPVLSQKETNMPSKQLVGEFASGVLRTSLAKTKDQKKTTVALVPEAEKRMTSSVPAGIKRKLVCSISAETKRVMTRSMSVDPKRKIGQSGDPETMSVSAGSKGKMSKSVSVGSEKKVTRSVSVNSKRKKTKSSSCDFKHVRKSLSNQLDNIGDLKHESHAKTDCVSLEKTNKRSRSGRLLLPPLEFWRNQIPVYDLDHKILEIREGPLVESPFRERGSQSQKKRRQ